MRHPHLSLVIGGASSGKSAYAEGLVQQSGLAKVYLATAEARDDEMAEKIAQHRQRRAGQGWRTVEAPREIAQELALIEDGEIALVDCVTFWLTNLMLAEADWQLGLDDLIDVLLGLRAPVVLVTNDVSGGVVPDNGLARSFRSAQGRVNQDLAAQADLVVQVTAGLPLALKGSLPMPADGADPTW